MNGYGRNNESRWGRYPGSDPAQHEDKMYRKRGIEVDSHVGEECKNTLHSTLATPLSIPPSQHSLPPAVHGRRLVCMTMLTLGVTAG